MKLFTVATVCRVVVCCSCVTELTGRRQIYPTPTPVLFSSGFIWIDFLEEKSRNPKYIRAFNILQSGGRLGTILLHILQHVEQL